MMCSTRTSRPSRQISAEGDGAPLASLVDGYRLLQLPGDENEQTFLDRQRHTQQVTGIWPGDVVTLWTTLFLETRADRFGTNDFAAGMPHLDLLCRQQRDALVELATGHA